MTQFAQEIVQQWERMEADRQPWLHHWQDCADHIAPDRADYTTQRSQGAKRTNHVYDSTAPQACVQAASGIHGLLTSPTLQWFHMRAQDDRLNMRDDCARWLDAATDALYRLFNGSTHNFASQSNELYTDLLCIGTSTMAILESRRVDVLFSTKPMRECVIAENEEDRVDTLCRRFPFTAKQAVQQWGDAAGEKVVKAADDPKRQTTKFHFLHMVRPRALRDVSRSDARHKPFESVYISLEDKAEISVGGFDEFPYLVPRMAKAAGETYGRSPGMLALPDIKTLNELVKQHLQANQLAVRPPVQFPDDGYLMPLNLTPGGRNPYRAQTRDRIEPVNLGLEVQVGTETIARLQAAINRAFYVEWLTMPSDPSDPAAAGKGVTATFTVQQRDEKMRLLSPMLARLQSEFLGPLIDRTFAIAWRRSADLRFGPGALFPQPPAALIGAPLRVEYVSPIAVAQKASQLDAVSRVTQTALLLAQIDPETPKVLDAEAILRLTASDLAAPAAILKTPAQLAAEAQAKAQAQQAEQQANALQSVGGAANDVSQSVKNIAQAGGAVGGNGAVQPMQQAA